MSDVLPKRWDVIPYITEEVSRQGHNVHTPDGWDRVAWMLLAWSHASTQHPLLPTVTDVIQLGKLIEPRVNQYGIRTCAVYVGNQVCPPAQSVSHLLVALFEEQRKGEMTPLTFYKAFEEIHPFMDGNGRTGKVLLNWVSGTLMRPTFPPNNLCGYEIRNP